MESWCFALPVAPGQSDYATKEAPEQIRARMDEYEESRRGAGFKRERVYHMGTPMGDFMIIYGEADRPLAQVVQAYATSGRPFDDWFVEMNERITGLDLRSGTLPEPRQVLNYVEEGAPRTRGLAFTAPPLTTDKAAELEAFFKEAESRWEELAESRRENGLTRDQAWLTSTPMGEVCCVYLEGDDPVASNEKWATSTSEYDTWFRDRVGEIFGMDFTEPLPPIEQVWDWSAD